MGDPHTGLCFSCFPACVLYRDTLGKCFFLRTEISLKGATYQISFTDTDQLPPPFRIDNISEVRRGLNTDEPLTGCDVMMEHALRQSVRFVLLCEEKQVHLILPSNDN